MRRLLVVGLLAAGCGRIGFATHDGGSEPRCFVEAASGRDHTCARDVSGNVWCWGWNANSQVQPGGDPIVLVPVKVELPGPAAQIGAGRVLSCARLVDGDVYCWGDNSLGELGDGTTANLAAPAKVALGDTALALGVETYGACVIRASDRAVACWGENQQYAVGSPTIDAIVSTPMVVAGTQGSMELAVGHRYGCVVLATGETRCWGRNEFGQGAETPAGSHASAELAGVVGARKIYAGGRHTCAIDAAGNVECWGKNQAGQLGTGAVSQGATSTPVASTERGISSLSLGAGATCAVHIDGRLDCWGDIDVGDGTLARAEAPTPTGLTGIASVGLGYYHACAVTKAGGLECWGSNRYGELGRGTRSLSATAVMLPISVTSVSVGGYHACALLSGSRAQCWGDNNVGELGTGDRLSRAVPTDVSPTGLASLGGIEAGMFETCAFRQNGAVACWGLTAYARAASTGPQLLPTIVAGITAAKHVAVGQSHTCAIDGTALKCWGLNFAGQLGDGTMTPSAAPVSVSLTTPTDLCTGADFTCALDGTTVKCWGKNDDGQLGDGTTTSSATPVLAPLPASATGIVCGSRHACARVMGGNMYCWGRNQSGELGLGDVGMHLSPTKVPLPGAISTLDAGGQTTCATIAATEYCWGNGDLGQIPDGMTFSRASPVRIPVLDGVGQITLTENGGCAHNNPIGPVVCWGVTELLGNGDTSYATPAPPLLTCPE